MSSFLHDHGCDTARETLFASKMRATRCPLCPQRSLGDWLVGWRQVALWLVGLLAFGTNSAMALTSTTTVLTSSVNPSYVSQNTTLTATVTPSTASGTVTFKDGTTTLGTGTLSGGVATLVKSFTTTGAHSLTAVYAGNSTFATSTSAVKTQTVNSKVTTTTTLSSSVNPAFVGQNSTLTATVTGTGPTGTVTFKDGTTTLGTGTLSGGVATLVKSFATTGSHSLTAVYAGDTANNASTSAAVAQAVNAKASTTTTLTSSVNPSYVGQSTTLTATVTGASPTGTVTFKDGSTTLGTGTLSGGAATFSATFSTTGSHSLTAVYAGDVGNNTSTSSAKTQTVKAKANSSIALFAETNPTYAGESTLFWANITGTSPSGTVTFKDGATTLGTSSVSAGQATINASFSVTGSHSLTAIYSGDAVNNGSTSAVLTETVSPSRTGTSTTLSSSVNPALVGQNTVFTATVTPSAATGNVVFRSNGANFAVVASSGGVATATASLSAGSSSVTASYVGDATYAPSTSPAINQVFQLNATTTELYASANPIAPGQSTTLTARVFGSSPFGTVEYFDGATSLGSVGVVGATGNTVTGLTVTLSALGAHSLTAVYSGNSSNAPSTSPVLTENVALASTTTSLSVSANPVPPGQSPTLTATVSGTSPTGTVTFFDGAASLGTATLAGGGNNPQASRSVAFSTLGAHNLTASYSGDSTNAASVSPIIVETVSPVNATIALGASAASVGSGTPVTLSAAVSGFSPTGTIVFNDGGNLLATIAVTAGQAVTTQAFSVTGLHNISATYSGDTNNTTALSNTVSLDVNPDTTSTSGPMTWIYGYDAEGNRWADVDPRGKQTTRSFDSLSRVTQVTRPIPSSGIGMSYDGQDNLIQVIDPRGLATTYTVDGLKNTKVQASPDTGSTNATYDAAGNLLTQADSRGKVTSYTYDALNRLTSASYASGTPTLFEYDGGSNPGPFSAGRLTKITDESGATTYAYDARGRVVTKTQVAGTKTLVVGYTWGSTGSATGSLTSVTYPSGSRVNYSYDINGRLSDVTVNPVNTNGVGINTGSSLNALSSITYNGANAVTGWTWSDGTPYQRGFDGFGRLSSYPLGNPNGTGSAAGLLRTLTFDDAARITGYTHTRSGLAQAQFDQAFIYDDLGHLTGNTQSTTVYGYSYDATGNQTLRLVGGSSYPQTIAPTSNRLMQSQSSSGTTTFSYDNAGNMLTDDVATYTYSDRGRMSSALVGSNTVNYRYNGLDQRVSKLGPTAVVPTGAAYYAYDEVGRLMGEYDANLVPVYETVYVGGMPVSVMKQTGTAASSTLQVSLYNVWADHVDTPRAISRSTDQALVWRWDTAEALGATVPDQNPSGLGTFVFNQRFPGQLLDFETGNFYNWHRDYRPTAGRYVQSDPIGLAGGINTYGYVGGDPVSNVDPQGLDHPGMGPYGGYMGRAPQIELGKLDPKTLLPLPGYELPEPPWIPPAPFPATGPVPCEKCKPFLTTCYLTSGGAGIGTGQVVGTVVSSFVGPTGLITRVVAGSIIGGIAGQSLSLQCQKAYNACLANCDKCAPGE